ncbi:hypothetical protein ATK36_4764 [Amycolatopsis sulphurea]|uniref:Uncharacterized protein n=1 Tax=Amycolatopsis sulphurea TaxID=76022 RepID=A0A2A9FE12_9PSEU|nr:hypothetical protein [Amycolatopsis sulphurea]PFG49604.1 hypothetical protein ATK36_4764 [Amycolatopsis sulphurea]
MRDQSTGLHPAPDLVTDEADTTAQEARRHKAALAVAAQAKDAEECAMLLDMLGLHTRGGSRTEVA